MKTLIAIMNFFGFRTAHQREVREHRSAGAKKGWAKRKTKTPTEVPHDVQ